MGTKRETDHESGPRDSLHADESIKYVLKP